MSEQTTLPAVAAHGARRLPSVDVDSYNVELKDSEGFIGDRASKGAFRNMIDRVRKSMHPKIDPAPNSNTEKEPDDWVSGDDPMTGAQASYLKTLSEQCGEPETFSQT